MLDDSSGYAEFTKWALFDLSRSPSGSGRARRNWFATYTSEGQLGPFRGRADQERDFPVMGELTFMGVQER